MNFKNLDIRISYITYGENNIRDALIVPALGMAKTYKRSVGFFSTSVFDTILDGVVDLARNNGHIQIIASPQLSQSDVDAITLGYETRELIMKSAFLKNFDQAVERLDSEKLKLAAQLIAKGVLDIKITDILNELPEISKDGSYHDKLGILEDPNGNSIVFVGSPNETINGLKKNYEKVRVFKSWNESQNEYVKDETEEFEMLWKGLNPYLKTYEFGQALAEHILQIKKDFETKQKRATTIVLRDYQQEAVDACFDVHIIRNQNVRISELKQTIKNGGYLALKHKIGDIAFNFLCDGFDKISDDIVINLLDQYTEAEITLPVEFDKDRMSSGEKQIFVMALYWSLMQQSKNDLPFIIDTPFARIDTEHRANVTEHFFLDLSGQLFVLSTNEELNGDHIEVMKDKVSDVYMLEYGDDKRTYVYRNKFFEV